MKMLPVAGILYFALDKPIIGRLRKPAIKEKVSVSDSKLHVFVRSVVRVFVNLGSYNVGH
jgi:hypothetical protein